MPPVGNDVVDFAAPGNPGKSGDFRFCQRVFTPEERHWNAQSSCPDEHLWAVWAAKEAAYKAVCRVNPTVCSIPKRYPVHGAVSRVLASRGETRGDPISWERNGERYRRFQAADQRVKKREPSPFILTPQGRLALRIDATEDWVHAMAAGSEAELDRLCCRVDRLEGSVDPSAFVRENLLREIARRTGCPAADLRIVKDPAGAGAPRVLLQGRLLTTRISLSHDGRFAAFVFVLPSEAIEKREPFSMVQRAFFRDGFPFLRA